MTNLGDVSINRIVLTGFMGAGKSTVGPLLASELGWTFVDLDAALVESHKASVAEIFAQVGESGFRAMESAILARLLLQARVVIALGGGTLEGADMPALLQASPHTHLLYLETSLEEALSRCRAQTGGAERPILADREGLAPRFAARQQHYQLAHQTVCTTGEQPQAVVRRILAGLPRVEAEPEDRTGANC